MISLYPHKDPARVIRNAVLDDVNPAKKGCAFLYWQGETDTEPKGNRKRVFKSVYDLYERGFVDLYQRRNGEEYSYFAVVI